MGSIQSVRPLSQVCTTGKASASPASPSGSFSDTQNICSSLSGSGPPSQTTVSTVSVILVPWLSIGGSRVRLVVDRFHPGTGCGFTEVTPSAILISTLVVGEPSQPWPTLNAVVM
jgi:hypothetical protein